MPKSKSATQSTKKVETKVVEQKVVEQKVVKPKTKKIVKKVKKAVVEEPVIEPEVVEETVVEEPVVEEPIVEQGDETDFIEDNAEEIISDKKHKQKRVITKDTIKSSWEDLLNVYSEELSHLKKKPEQRQSLLKALKELKSDCFRLMKIRNKAPSSGNSKSGFNMPVNVSSEMQKFISSNQDTDSEITRSHITRTLCAYVKNKDLQNPKDRREILPDNTLKLLFSMEDDQSDKLTYYSMQRKIQQHIVKN